MKPRMDRFPSEVGIERHLTRKDGRTRLDWQNLTSNLWLEVSNAYRTDKELLVDLSEFSIISADSLVLILAILRERSRLHPGKTGVALPVDMDGLEYLANVGFLGHLVNLSIPVLNQHPELVLLEPNSTRRKGSLLVTLQAISAAKLKSLGTSIDEILKEELDRRNVSVPAGSDRQYDLFAFRNLLFELIHNAVKHAPPDSQSNQHEPVGFACYRPWPRSYPKIRLVVADWGEGFRKTLDRKRCSTRDDLHAIEEALLYRFFNPDHKVISLFEAMSFLGWLKGRLTVVSGCASAELSLQSPSERARFEIFLKDPGPVTLRSVLKTRLRSEFQNVPGVHYCVDLSLPMPEVSE